MAGISVVKFGGGLLASADRDGLLGVAARRGAIVAPGGGLFADAVRAAQAWHGVSDRAAHAMAILAMDQTACLLADLAPDLALCATATELAAATAAGRGAVWRPSPMALDADLPASWDVSSDSLALWLAIELGAERLVVLKAAALPGGSSPANWAAAGLVDPVFPRLAARFTGAILGVGPATANALDAALGSPVRQAA